MGPLGHEYDGKWVRQFVLYHLVAKKASLSPFKSGNFLNLETFGLFKFGNYLIVKISFVDLWTFLYL